MAVLHFEMLLSSCNVGSAPRMKTSLRTVAPASSQRLCITTLSLIVSGQGRMLSCVPGPEPIFSFRSGKVFCHPRRALPGSHLCNPLTWLDDLCSSSGCYHHGLFTAPVIKTIVVTAIHFSALVKIVSDQVMRQPSFSSAWRVFTFCTERPYDPH